MYPDSEKGALIDACLATLVAAPHPTYPVNASCVCAGISGVVRVCVSAHHVEPSVVNVQVFLPTGTLPRKSGRLNVVLQSPTQ